MTDNEIIKALEEVIFMADNNTYTFSQIVEMAEIKHKSEVENILKQKYPYKLIVTDFEKDIDSEFYISDNLMDDIYQLLCTHCKKTDRNTNLPYIIQKKDILDKTTDNARS